MRSPARVLACYSALLALALTHCSDVPDSNVDGPRLDIAVAALDLPSVTNATYTLTVTAGGETVWERTIDSDGYGDGAGSVSYVGPCDADAGDNVVSLSLVSLEDATGTLPTSDYVNPTLPDPLTQTVTCDPNVDTPVTFNISVMRTATQGFFDVAVSFSDIFCSAKLDCGATTDSADDLNLLHRAGGGRDMTAVLALACTGGAGADTHLYLDNVEIDCGGANPTVVDVSGQGNVDLDVAPSANPDGYLFGAMVSRGSEAIYDKAYWNVSLGLDEASFPATDCRLTTTATASDGPLDGGSTPDNTTWPIIEWDVVLSTSGARACTQHPLNGTPAGVAATYTPLSTPEAFDWVLVRAPDALVDEANCNPATRTADDYCGCPAVDCTASNKTCDATTDPGAPACVGNFYGDGSDGDLVVSAPLSLTVPTKHGAYDGDMVVMQYDNLTVSDTLTLEQPARGLLVYVTGDLHVTSGGRISMTARGAAVNPAAAGVSSAGLRFRRLDATGTEALAVGGLLTGAGAAAVAAEDNQPELVGNGTVYSVQRTGAAGGPTNAQSGSSGGVGQSGGGGSGGGYNVNAAGGGAGTCFSGGTGGGGSGGSGGGGAGQAYGGQGGNGTQGGAGGAGNPVGGGGGGPTAGTGGLLVLIVRGDVTVDPGGAIEANGSRGGNSGSGGGGGSSGGGNVLILHGGAFTNNGTIEAAGGTATSGALGGGTNGGAGGAGSVQVGQIDP